MILGKKMLEYPSSSLGLELFQISKIVKIFMYKPHSESFANIERNMIIALK
jgi:hypothetical protein